MKHDKQCKDGTGNISGDGMFYEKPVVFIMKAGWLKTSTGWSMCSKRTLATFMKLLFYYYEVTLSHSIYTYNNTHYYYMNY